MSLYQLHRCVWDQIRAGEVSSGADPTFDASRYDLTDDERKAFENQDVAEFYRLGLHPVLLNGFCCAAGLSHDTYRGVLEVFATTEHRRARWQR